jgi:UDP-4-amino-4,6-dideoxy-N-acetyl-beta-L-altrosamine N-acetyltransferase
MELRLRKIQENDLIQIMNMRMLPEVTRYMYTDPKLNIESQKKWFKNIEESNEDLYWIIEFENVDIGVLSINNIDNINKRCSWAYYIGDSSFRGRGIATNLECNIYDYVFEILKLNKLCCEVFEFNKKVIDIHKKFGSEIEGVLKEHILKENKFYNVVIMGITKNMWISKRKTYNYEKINIE